MSNTTAVKRSGGQAVEKYEPLRNSPCLLLPFTNLRDCGRNTASRCCAVVGFRCKLEQQTPGVRFMRSIWKIVACLCLLLTCWSAIALVAHHHSNRADSAKCTVCIAAHSANPKATSNLENTSFHFVGVARLEPVASKQFILAYALTNRPPPQV